jgi:hypothetical protein
LKEIKSEGAQQFWRNLQYNDFNLDPIKIPFLKALPFRAIAHAITKVISIVFNSSAYIDIFIYTPYIQYPRTSEDKTK